MFIILTGSSGVGKNTIIKELEKADKNFKLVPTYTTRSKRKFECDGNPYYFITKEEFQNKIKQGELIEHELIHNNYYGSSYKMFDDLLKQYKVLIKDIGIEGAENLAVKLSDRTSILKVFLTTNSKKELKNRLKNRGEQQIKLRLKRYRKEQKQKYKFDYLILNEDLNKTVNIITTIYKINNEEILPTKPVCKMKLSKIQQYCDKLLKGKNLKPIVMYLNNNKAYIKSGQEKFLASILTKKRVCKKIFLNKQGNILNEKQINEWKKLIKESL